MAERLSFRLTDMLVKYFADVSHLRHEEGVNACNVMECGVQAARDAQIKHDLLKEKYKAITDEEKEKMLQRSDQLLREIDVIHGLIKLMEEEYPRYKVNFDSIQKPAPITDLSAFIDKMKQTVGRMHDTTLSGGFKKLIGWDGWKLNGEAAGEIYLQLDEALAKRDKEHESQLPNFKKFCEAEAAKLKKEQDKINSELQKKLDGKTAENKQNKAVFEQRRQKLMGDPRIKAIENELRLVGPMIGKPEGWESYTPATELPMELLMARTLAMASNFYIYEYAPEGEKEVRDYLDPFARQFSFYNPKVQGFVTPETFKVNYNLILWAETDGGVAHPAGLYRDIVLRQMRFMPLKSTRSFFIDPKGLGHNMDELIKLTKEQGGCGVCTLVTQSDEIGKTMAELRQYVTKVRQTLTVSGEVDTTNYNERPDVKKKIPYTTLVIHNFPYGFTAQAIDDLRTIINQANDCGFTILISRDKNESIDDNAKELFYNSGEGFRLEYRGEKCVFTDGGFKQLLRRMAVDPSDRFLDEFNKAYSYRPPVKSGFFDHLTPDHLQKPFRGSSAKGIRFPFAVDSQGKVQELVLDSDLKSYGLIIGGIGAGKTSLLHTIINSAAIHYSPQELEMWLIDYKLTSFDFYKRNMLPHLRHIVMDESDVLTYSVVDELRIEYARRQRLFKQSGAKDFADYREKGGSLPRLLVIVDETHLMSQALADDPDYKLHMQNIIAQARYTGINILFSDQKYSALGGFSESCKSDMYVRITLKNAIDQVKDTLGVYNMSSVSEEIAASINSMPAAAAGTMIYKHEERNPDDPKTKLVHYDHISSLYAPTDAFAEAVCAVRSKTPNADYHPCEVYEGPTRLCYAEEEIARYESRNPLKNNEGDRFYIGSPRGMGRCFSFSLKPEDEGENILLVGSQNELRGPMVANCIRNAIRHGYRVVVLALRSGMFYKKNKQFVLSLAEEFGTEAEFYTDYAEICRYIGLKAIELKKLDEDDGDDIPETERTFVVCLGTDDLYKKMDDDPNTQAKAWAGLKGSTAEKGPQEDPEPKNIPGSLNWDGLLGNIDQILSDLYEQEPVDGGAEKKESGGSRFDDAIDELDELLGPDVQTMEADVEELGAGIGVDFPVTAPKSIGSTEGLQGYNATSDLFVLIRDGWKLGYHTLLTVNSANGLKNMTRIKLSGNFNHRIALPMAPEQGGAFLYYTKALKNIADENDHIGAVYEYMGGNGQRFIPYDEEAYDA